MKAMDRETRYGDDPIARMNRTLEDSRYAQPHMPGDPESYPPKSWTGTAHNALLSFEQEFPPPEGMSLAQRRARAAELILVQAIEVPVPTKPL